MKNEEITKTCLMFIVATNGAFIAAESPYSFIHYLITLGFGLPLAYKLGKGE